MEKLTRVEAIRRWNEARKQKEKMIAKMREVLYEDYKKRTGKEPLTFNVL